MPEEKVEGKAEEKPIEIPKPLNDEDLAEVKALAEKAVELMDSLDDDDGAFRTFVSGFLGPRFMHTLGAIVWAANEWGAEVKPPKTPAERAAEKAEKEKKAA